MFHFLDTEIIRCYLTTVVYPLLLFFTPLIASHLTEVDIVRQTVARSATDTTCQSPLSTDNNLSLVPIQHNARNARPLCTFMTQLTGDARKLRNERRGRGWRKRRNGQNVASVASVAFDGKFGNYALQVISRVSGAVAGGGLPPLNFSPSEHFLLVGKFSSKNKKNVGQKKSRILSTHVRSSVGNLQPSVGKLQLPATSTLSTHAAAEPQAATIKLLTQDPSFC